MIDILCARPHRLWEPMLEEIALAYKAGRQVVLLVPEQYTLQAERDLLRDLHLPGFFRLEILSPSRLEYRVFESFGADKRAHIDERGKLIALTRALQKTAKDLDFYTACEDRPGFVKRMSGMLSTLKGLHINAEGLLERADADEKGRPLWSKLRDTALILSAYEEILAGRFADREDVLADMLLRLKNSAMFLDKQVFVYGFDVLTETLSEILLIVAGQADSLSLRLVSDKAQAEDGDAFEAVQASVVRLMDKFRDQHLVYQFHWMPAAPLLAPNDLAHLERSLLSLGAKPFSAPPDSLRLYAAPTPYQEVQHLAQQIVLEIRRGVNPEEIMMLCGNLPLYQGIISSSFDSFGIPYYLSDKLPLSAHPIVRAMLSALACAAGGYRTEDVEEYIKSGFSPLTHREGWRLQNYARSYGIKHKKWLTPFVRGEEDERSACESLRLKLTQPIEQMHLQLVQAETCTNSFQCLLLFFEQSGIYAKAEALEEELRLAGLQKQVAQLRQVFEKLEELFLQMAALMEDERIPLKHFPLWLENGMSEQAIASLPQGSSLIQVGQLGNLLPHRPKIVFAFGLNDGILSSADDDLLTQEETRQAEQIFKSHFGLDLADRQKMASLDLLKALSSPRERLYLSYAMANEEGGVLYPLHEIKALLRIFPLLVEEGGALSGRADDAAALPLSPNPALETLALKLQKGEISGLWLDAWAWLGQDENYRGQAKALLDSLSGDAPVGNIGEIAAASIFDTKRSSVSRLESFASCPFRHFVDYGLKPQPLEEWAVQAVDTGRFYHDAMDHFTRLAMQDAAWPNIGRDAAEELMNTALAPLIAGWQELPFNDTARLCRVSQGYVKVARRMAWVVTQGARQGSFRPVQTELRFGQGGILPAILLKLPDGSLIELHGIIDRLDQYQGEEGTYLRIIDYKSGSISLSPEKLFEGTQLQLMIYLKAALDALPQAKPAGAFYQRLTDPLIDTEDEDKAAKEGDKRLRLSGIVLKDIQVVRLMDGVDGKTLGALFNKDESPGKNKPLLTQEEMRALCDHAQDKAEQLAGEIVSGDIKRDPAVYQDKHRACDFCPHQGICRIDWHHNAGGHFIPSMSMENLLQAISQPCEKKE